MDITSAVHLGQLFPTGGIARRLIALLHAPGFADTGARQEQHILTHLAVDAVQGPHQRGGTAFCCGVSEPGGLTIDGRIKIHQHHPGLGIAEAGAVDALQRPQCNPNQLRRIVQGMRQRNGNALTVLRILLTFDIALWQWAVYWAFYPTASLESNGVFNGDLKLMAALSVYCDWLSVARNQYCADTIAGLVIACIAYILFFLKAGKFGSHANSFSMED